jgi:hypothetical protein
VQEQQLRLAEDANRALQEQLVRMQVSVQRTLLSSDSLLLATGRQRKCMCQACTVFVLLMGLTAFQHACDC